MLSMLSCWNASLSSALYYTSVPWRTINWLFAEQNRVPAVLRLRADVDICGPVWTVDHSAEWATHQTAPETLN